MSQSRAEALARLRPGVPFVLNGDELTWLDEVQDAPTEQEIADKLAELEAAATRTLVDAERERRIALPLTVSLGETSFRINMDALAQRNLGGLASVGQYLVATASAQTTAFRDYDNVSHDLTGADLVALGLQVAARIQFVFGKSWAIKAMDPIPADFRDDSYWAD